MFLRSNRADYTDQIDLKIQELSRFSYQLPEASGCLTGHLTHGDLRTMVQLCRTVDSSLNDILVLRKQHPQTKAADYAPTSLLDNSAKPLSRRIKVMFAPIVLISSSN